MPRVRRVFPLQPCDPPCCPSPASGMHTRPAACRAPGTCAENCVHVVFKGALPSKCAAALRTVSVHGTRQARSLPGDVACSRDTKLIPTMTSRAGVGAAADDSYEHEVWNWSDERRVVLSVAARQTEWCLWGVHAK